MKLLTEEQVRERLRKHINDKFGKPSKFGAARRFAARIGVSDAFISLVMSGKKNVPGSWGHYLGLRKAWIAVDEESDT